MKKGLFFIIFVILFSLTINVSVEASNGKTVVIDPGHGGKFSGTAGYSGNSTGYLEKHANLEVSFKLRDVLIQKGFKVYMTRESDRDFGDSQQEDLAKRMEIANEYTAGNRDNSVFISVHHNATPNGPYASGYETYYFDIDKGIDSRWPPDPIQKQYSPESKRLAYTIHNTVLDNMPVNEGPRGIVANNLFVTRNAQMASTLVELGYMSNPEDERRIKTDAYQQKGANAIAKAVVDYFDVYEVYDHNDNRLKVYKSKDEALNFAKSRENVYVFDKTKQKRIFDNFQYRFGVYHTSVDSISKLFITKDAALNYSKDWKHTRVVDNESGEILWSNYLDKSYIVEHPANGVLSKHYQVASAIEYAKDWKHTVVRNVNNEKILWTNYRTKKYKIEHTDKKIVKEFYNKQPAVNYAKTWKNTKVINKRTDQMVWDNIDSNYNYSFKENVVASNHRITTAVEVSKELYPDGFPNNHTEKTVILSTAYKYADALSAAPLAANLVMHQFSYLKLVRCEKRFLTN